MKTSFKGASVWGVVWRFLVLMVLFQIISLIVLIGLGSLPENTVIGFLVNLILFFVSPLVTYFILYGIVKNRVLKQHYSWDAIKGRTSIDWKTIGQLALMTIPVVLVASSFTSVFLLVATQFEWVQSILYDYLYFSMLSGNMSVVYLFINTVILAPIFEELFFRGYVLNKWAEKHKQTSAIFWSSFVFMTIHIPSLLVPQLILGVFAAVVYMKTKKLVYPIFVHSLYNLLVIAPSFFTDQTESVELIEEEVIQTVYPNAATTRSYVVGTVIFLVFLAITVFIFKRYGSQMNKTLTPYVANVHQAEDYIEYESTRELTEEEVIEQWEEEQEEPKNED